MRRREFITIFACAAGIRPLDARAQQRVFRRTGRAASRRRSGRARPVRNPARLEPRTDPLTPEPEVRIHLPPAASLMRT